MVYYENDVIEEVINLDEYKNSYFKIGYRYNVEKVFDNFIKVCSSNNSCNRYLKFYEITLYKRPLKNWIKFFIKNILKII